MPRQKSTPSKHGLETNSGTDDSVVIPLQDAPVKLEKLEGAVKLESEELMEDCDSITVKSENSDFKTDFSEKSSIPAMMGMDFDRESGIANDSSTGAGSNIAEIDIDEVEMIDNESPDDSNHDVMLSEKPMKGFALGVLNPKILSWIDSKYKIDEGARTAVQDIITLYKHEFPKDAMYVPLQSYQVGQLVRKVFPTIGRCKISVAGKRIWVYKNLGRRDPNPFVPQIADQINLNKFERYGIGANANSSPSGSPSPISPANGGSQADLAGYNRQKLYESLPTMMSFWEPSEDSGSMASSTGNDYDNYAIVSAAKRRKTLMNSHTIDNEVVQWIRDNYEASDGFYVKSLELLAHYNSNNPRKPLQNLSQVGRLLKNSINQQCKHLRRYFKASSGGKREWVYTNIRVKANAKGAFDKAVEGNDWSQMPTEKGHIPRMENSVDSSPVSPESIIAAQSAAAAAVPATENSNGGTLDHTQSMSNSNQSSNSQNSMSKIPPQNFMKTPRQNGHNAESSFEMLKDLNVDGWMQTACSSKYVEWVKPVHDFLIDQKRIIMEVRIVEDWDILIHAHGRKVYPESLQITYVDHSVRGVEEFLQQMNTVSFCRGFPAPYYRALEIQGHIVSQPEIWSTRSDSEKEEIRHRSINCTLLHKTEGNFCSACFHSCRLNMQRIRSPMQD